MSAAIGPAASSGALGHLDPPASGPFRRLAFAAPYLPLLVEAGAVTALFAIVFHCIGGAKFPNDDAYIGLHNAQVLWLGHDAAYRGVPALVGATSGVHLALLMLFESLVSPAPLALFVLCAAAAVAYVLAIHALCLNAGCSRAIAFAFAIASLCFAGSLFQFLNGLETGLAMTAVACDLALLASNRYRWLLAILCGLMPFVRPELAVLSLGSMLIVFGDSTKSRGEKTVAAALAIAAAIPFLAWYWIDTGSFIPSTIDAKNYFYAQANLPMAAKFIWFAQSMIVGIVYAFPIFLCVPAIRSRPLRALCLSFVAIVLFAYLERLPGGLRFNSGRYLFIFVPIVLYGLIDAYAAPEPWRRRLARRCMVAALIPTVGAAVQQYQSYKYYLTFYRAGVVETVAWANAHIPPGAMVMVHDAGYVAYAGDFRLVDLTGLKTPRSVAINRQLTFPANGAMRPQAMAEIADLFHPRYLIAVKSWNADYRIAQSLRRDGWRVTRIFESARAPRDAEIYEIFALRKN